MIPVATAYMTPAKTVSLPGLPGTPMNFSAGRCIIYDTRMITIAMRNSEVTIYPSERYRTHVDQWIAQCGENYPARAKIALHDGTILYPPLYTAEEPAPEE